MNLPKLFEMQRVLDTRIVQERGLDESELLFKKIDAFRVELHELENETKHFKYWSSKQPDKSKILEEYVDGLHFILSIGLELGEQHYESIVTDTLGKQFRTITLYAVLMYEDNYYSLLSKYYLGLGEMLGFTWYEIEQAYVDKNSVNHQRQESGVY